MAIQSSLLEPSPEPVMANATQWIGDVMLGEIALGLCVLAVAFVGALMLTGRLPVREGVRVVVGCFVLLGAPVIASGFMVGGEDGLARSEAPLVIEPRASEPLRDLPRARNDPYSGA